MLLWFTFQIFAVQHVDVCMFSNGKFKNVVAEINENHLIKPNENRRKVYSLLPMKGIYFLMNVWSKFEPLYMVKVPQKTGLQSKARRRTQATTHLCHNTATRLRPVLHVGRWQWTTEMCSPFTCPITLKSSSS